MPSTSEHLPQIGTMIGLCPSVEGAIRTSTERLSDVSTVRFSEVSTSDFAVSVPLEHNAWRWSPHTMT